MRKHTAFMLVASLIASFNCTNLQAECNGYCKDQDYQTQAGLQDVNSLFATPINISTDGIEHFLRNIYNHPSYAKDFLPNNFTHLTQFLKHNTKTRAYVQSVMRLFANKLKSSSYVNAHRFSSILDELPLLLEKHFLITKSKYSRNMEEIIRDLMHNRLNENKALHKKDPLGFFDDLAQEVLFTIEEESIIKADIAHEELRKTTLVFLEVSLAKCVWSPEDGIESWRSVKKISESLTRLMDYNVINDPDDLNDLFVTLIERYCFFLDLVATDLPATFFTELKHEIATSSPLLLFDLEEQEPYLETKKSKLLRAVDATEQEAIRAKTIALNYLA